MPEQPLGGQVLDEPVVHAGLLEKTVIEEVAGTGSAIVRGALPEVERWMLLSEADAAHERFLTLPRRVNGVHQQAEQLTVRIGNPRHPSLNLLALSLSAAVADLTASTTINHYMPTEGRYMRYTGTSAGLGAHRDGKCYTQIVCVFSIAGSAPFTVFADKAVRARHLLVEPGDLILLRAPGLGGATDGRPRHAVGAPLGSDRVSLTLRMSGKASAGRTGRERSSGASASGVGVGVGRH